MIIAIDFDGTCVKHRYPAVGEDIGAVPVLKKLLEKGHKLMLWTMRSGKTLHDARTWFEKNNIQLWDINRNPEQAATNWSTSNKQYANLYIDDAALGCPLIEHFNDKPYVDWEAVEVMLKKQNII